MKPARDKSDTPSSGPLRDGEDRSVPVTAPPPDGLDFYRDILTDPHRRLAADIPVVCDMVRTGIITLAGFRAVLAAGYDPMQRDASGATIYFYALCYNRSDILAVLLSPDFIHLATHQHDSAAMQRSLVHIAAFEGNIPFVERLVRAGLSPNIPDAQGRTPLAAAITKHNPDMVRTLIRNGADVADYERTHKDASLLQQLRAIAALHNDHVTENALLHILLSSGASPDKYTDTQTPVLTQYVMQARFVPVQKILAHGGNPNIVNTAAASLLPLDAALMHDTDTIANTLLDHGADPNICGHEHPLPLVRALLRGWTHMTENLLAAGADVNAVHPHNGTTVIGAVLRRYPAAGNLKRLLAMGADVNLRETVHRRLSPLHLAVTHSNGETACVDLLLARGADPHVTDAAGYKPVDTAHRMFGAAHPLTRRLHTVTYGGSSLIISPDKRPPRPCHP